MAEAFQARRAASQSISAASNGGRGSQEAADACSSLRWAIRCRHSAVDKGRGGRIVARHTDSQELSKSLDEESTEELASGTFNQEDDGSHDNDVFASDTEKSSSQSVQDDSSVQNSNIVPSVEEDKSENVISVEIAEPRRSGRERKQTALYGNPLLYTITCKLTPRFVPVFFNKMSETLESLQTNYLMESKSDDSS